MKLPTLIACLGLSTNALAGGWIGGGGELFEATMNPWFVQQGVRAAPHIVRYCIEVDEANFGVSQASLKGHVRAALDGWVDEFASAYVPDNGPNLKVLIAKEAFVPVDACSDQVQLRFQFGVLTEEQLREFADRRLDPKHFVALAMQTDYDRNLQSKGFVYVAPPRGPLAMATPDLKPDPWNDNQQYRLFAVLRHELGHVFGIQHTGTHEDVMGSGFPEYIVSNQSRYLFPRGVFRIPLGSVLAKMCFLDRTRSRLFRYFDVPAGDLCIGFRVRSDLLEVVSSQEWDSPVRIVGVAPFDLRSTLPAYEPVVRLWLPDDRTLFLDAPATVRLLLGPMIERRQLNATFKNVDTGTQRELTLRLAPEKVQIDGVLGGRSMLDLFGIQMPEQ